MATVQTAIAKGVLDVWNVGTVIDGVPTLALSDIERFVSVLAERGFKVVRAEEASNVTEPTMTLKDAQAAVETKTAPRVTIDYLKSEVKEARYFFDGTLTICVLEMQNGFKAVGKAAPADERNFDVEIGKRYAYEDAFRSLWPAAGYQLCSELRGRRIAP